MKELLNANLSYDNLFCVGIYGAGCLITEGSRGEGGYLLNSEVNLYFGTLVQQRILQLLLLKCDPQRRFKTTLEVLYLTSLGSLWSRQLSSKLVCLYWSNMTYW
jgi:succinate dehydrogenase/fumarate reductase flavoprotein subunit